MKGFFPMCAMAGGVIAIIGESSLLQREESCWMIITMVDQHPWNLAIAFVSMKPILLGLVVVVLKDLF